jgi:hypothetical protein
VNATGKGEELLARSWCAQWGRNAVIRKEGGPCFACAVRSAGKSGLGFGVIWACDRQLKEREVRLEVSALWRATATVAPSLFANQGTEPWKVHYTRKEPLHGRSFLVYGLGLDRSCPNRSLSPPLRLLYYLFPHSPLHLSRPTNTTTGLHPGLLSHFQAFNVSRIRVRYCGILGPSISGRSVRIPSFPSELSDKVSESGDIRAPVPLRSIPPGHPTALLTKSIITNRLPCPSNSPCNKHK